MLTIHSLENVPDDLLYEAFRDAFKDYEMQLNKGELLRMLHRRGFMPQLSFGAFDGDRLVAFTFNGTGQFMDRPTAYDTGTGTLEAYRGKGLAGRIFNHSIPPLKRAGISRYLLEVLQHNKSAVSLYRKLGFRVTREFNYFSEETSLLRKVTFHRDPKVTFSPVTLSEKKRMRSFWDQEPSWQNSFEAVERAPEDFLILGAQKENSLVGYIIFEPASGDITQLAVDPVHRRTGIGSRLLTRALSGNQHHAVKAINYTTDQEGISFLMESFGITWKGTQYEMVKDI